MLPPAVGTHRIVKRNAEPIVLIARSRRGSRGIIDLLDKAHA